MSNPIVHLASVKVMRSHDYCHFEVNLSASIAHDSTEYLQQVDALRKDAARLTDKAVEQYKTARAVREKQNHALEKLRWDARHALQTPDSERTPDQQAAIKALRDYNWQANQYDYQDDWLDDLTDADLAQD
jgi:hypothetical protein